MPGWINTPPLFNHKGFEHFVELPGTDPNGMAFASICEVDADGRPFQGAASMEVHNVVPEPGGVRVRGFIGWDSDVGFRLSIYRAAP